ncbi:hypothetical protein ZEAMMB73_Zm00001d012797 [Zea mays]|uniref:Ubiquitin-like protease family profile domain-containing protein n=1 Tax=Zea mays TaxID=4577 RepID=A0A1D6GCI8_MAIZE|nr:hypothetical protein ZEAMMB73_Zm00001d012797 [Zea mays]
MSKVTWCRSAGVKKKANMPQGKSKKNVVKEKAKKIKKNAESRVFTHFLMDRAKVHENTDQIEINIREGVSIWITKAAVQKCFEFPPGTDKKLPIDPTTKTFDSLYRVLSVSEKKINVKKKKMKENMKEKQVEEEKIEMNMEEKKQNLVEDEGSQQEESEEEDGEDGEIGEEEGEDGAIGDAKVGGDGDKESAKRGGIKVAVRRNVLTPLNINLMLQNINNDEILKLLVKRNEDTDGTEPNLDIDLISSVAEFGKDKKKLISGCTTVLMVVFLDHLVENPLDPLTIPRINLYTSDFIADLIMVPKDSPGPEKKRRKMKKKTSNVIKNLATLNFKNSEDTCYHEDSEMVPSPGRASPVVASVQSHKNFVDHADLEIVPSHENSVDLHSVYMAHVLERSRQSIVVDILDYNIPESTFADCLLPTGHMHTDVFYLQCQLLSKDWKDKVILSWKATQELIHQDIGVKELDKELTAEVMNKVDLIFIPIIHAGHWSLVILSTAKQETYILDSYPRHSGVAKDVLTQLQKYLDNKHNFDMSNYTDHVPPVQHQKNNYDCGFHVLLYIEEFMKEKMYKINKKMVLKFRKQLCMNLLYHPLNRINLVEFRKKLGITLKRKLPGILDLTIEGERSESEAAVIIEIENRDDKTLEDEHISVEKEKLRKHKFTSDKINDEICKHILNYNERELLSVGQTTMTGGQLEKYVNEGDNGDKILRAFITCFTCDEKFNQGNITTVIPPHEVSEEGELSKVDAAQLVEEIKAVLKGTNVARVRKDTESTKDPKVKVFRNMRRTFIFFPFYKNEELFVFHVDTKRLPIIDALFCKMSSLSFEDRS